VKERGIKRDDDSPKGLPRLSSTVRESEGKGRKRGDGPGAERAAVQKLPQIRQSEDSTPIKYQRRSNRHTEKICRKKEEETPKVDIE